MSVRGPLGRVAQMSKDRSTPTRARGGLGSMAARVANQARGNSRASQPVKRNHMADSDEAIASSGEGLRRLVGKIASRGRVAAAKGGPIRRAEGGKVGSAMNALRQLAKEYKVAVMMDDKDTADRIRRRMELVKPGSSKEVDKASDQSGRDMKVSTFSKGGKVKGAIKTIRARMDDLEGYIREGFGSTREEAHANLRKEVAKDNGDDTVDALLKEHGVTYKRSKE